MARVNIETGIYRVFLVFWALTVFGSAVAGFDRGFDEEAGIGLLMALIGPWIAMKAVRWAYRGFVPKD